MADVTANSDVRPASGPRVLVMGASGYIGTNLVPRLVAQGYTVRACARDVRVLEARDWHGVELVAADLQERSTLTAALDGMDIAYYLVHSMAAGRNFGQLDLAAADNFVAAGEGAALKRIIYLGGLVPEGADSEHLVSRRTTGERLRAGRVPVTEIRAGIIVGPGSAAFEVIRDLVNHLPIMVTPRWVQAKSPPIALDNLLEYLVRIAELVPESGIYDAAGPELLSYEELMLQYGEVIGRRPLIIRVPVLTPKLSSYWLRLVTSVPTNIARALIEGLKFDIRADDRRLRELIPQRLLTYREAIAAVAETERRAAVAARWTEGALMFRDYNPGYAYYAKRSAGSAVAEASLQAVWEQVVAIGGKNRYYHANVLWTLRELFDALIGGPGMRRGRRHPTDVRIGDTVDSWRVVGVEPLERLTLGFSMKAPGAGVLEFELVSEAPGRTRVTATAYWHPAGVWGLAYWYAFAPAHGFIFRGLTRAIARRAEAAEPGERQSVGSG